MCHGVKIRKEEERLFCQKFIRCNAHIKKPDLNLADYAKHLDTTSSNDSDDDFAPKKKKKTGKGSKQKAAKVATPCHYNLADMTNRTAKRPGMNTSSNSVATENNNMANKNNTVSNSDTINYSDSILATHTVDSVERMNSISIKETAGSFVVQYGEEDEERVVGVSARIAAGITKVGAMDGENVLINISPKPKPFPAHPVQPQQLTPAQHQQIVQAAQYIQSQSKFVPPKKTHKTKSDDMCVKKAPSSARPKRNVNSKFPAKIDILERMNESDSDFND